MDSTTVLTIGQEAMKVMMLITAPLLLAGLVTGLLVGMVQAATQINEMTLSFIPKLIVVAVVLMATGPWMLQMLIEYTRQLMQQVPSLIG